MIRSKHRMIFAILALGVSLFLASGAPAQNKKKKGKDDPAAAQTVNADLMKNLPDQEKIDFTISEMLGAWQIGDVDKLHKDIADDVIMVNGMWGPPIVGWANYLASYNAQRGRAQQIRLDRSNTLIRVSGNTATACYQWEFSGVVDGKQSGARGQTTLLFEKRAEKWMIVLNHSSIVENGVPVTPGMQTQPQPAAAKP